MHCCFDTQFAGVILTGAAFQAKGRISRADRELRPEEFPRKVPHPAEVRRVRDDAAEKKRERFPQLAEVYPTLTEKIHSYTIAAS